MDCLNFLILWRNTDRFALPYFLFCPLTDHARSVFSTTQRHQVQRTGAPLPPIHRLPRRNQPNKRGSEQTTSPPSAQSRAAVQCPPGEIGPDPDLDFLPRQLHNQPLHLVQHRGERCAGIVQQLAMTAQGDGGDKLVDPPQTTDPRASPAAKKGMAPRVSRAEEAAPSPFSQAPR